MTLISYDLVTDAESQEIFNKLVHQYAEHFLGYRAYRHLQGDRRPDAQLFRGWWVGKGPTNVAPGHSQRFREDVYCAFLAIVGDA